jgi:multidrug resistance efflux pump
MSTNCCRRGGTLVNIVVVSGLAVGVTAVVLWDLSSRGKESVNVMGAGLAQAERGDFEILTTATGELEAKNQIEIRSRLESSTQIAEIVPEGTRVVPGDLLVRLNSDQIKNQLDQAELEYENVRLRLQSAEHARDIQINENEQKRRQAQLKIELAELERLKWLEGDAKTMRQELSLSLSKSGLEVDRLAEKLQRSYGLLERGFLSKDEFERDHVAYIEAQSAWITAQLETEVFENYDFRKQDKKFESDLQEATADLRQVELNNRIQLESKEAEVTTQKRLLSMAEEKVTKFRGLLANTRMVAPSAGLVVHASSMSRNNWGGNDSPMAIGRNVSPNELMMVLPDTSEMVAAVRVPEAMVDRIRKGQAARVRVYAAGESLFEGVVDGIGVLAEQSNWRDPNNKEYTVRIALVGGPPEGLKPSMRCEARLLLDKVQDSVHIPVQAVFADGPVRFVYVPASGGKVQRRPVALGRQSDTRAEILAGLDVGSTVLTREPDASEIVTRPWDSAELASAGYQVGPDGQIIAPRRGGTRPADDHTPREAPGQASRPASRGTAASASRERPAAGSSSPAGSPEAARGGSGGGATDRAAAPRPSDPR